MNNWTKTNLLSEGIDENAEYKMNNYGKIIMICIFVLMIASVILKI